MDQKAREKKLLKASKLSENQTCVDCGDVKPTWASIIVPPIGVRPGEQAIGAFCCFHCSGIHRRLGVHIAFVKSVTLDEWNDAEVQAMEIGGNCRVNAAFEARLFADILKPNALSTMETRGTFITSKYKDQQFFNTEKYKSGTIALQQSEVDALDLEISKGMCGVDLFADSNVGKHQQNIRKQEDSDTHNLSDEEFIVSLKESDHSAKSSQRKASSRNVSTEGRRRSRRSLSSNASRDSSRTPSSRGRNRRHSQASSRSPMVEDRARSQSCRRRHRSKSNRRRVSAPKIIPAGEKFETKASIFSQSRKGHTRDKSSQQKLLRRTQSGSALDEEHTNEKRKHIRRTRTGLPADGSKAICDGQKPSERRASVGDSESTLDEKKKSNCRKSVYSRQTEGRKLIDETGAVFLSGSDHRNRDSVKKTHQVSHRRKSELSSKSSHSDKDSGASSSFSKGHNKHVSSRRTRTGRTSESNRKRHDGFSSKTGERSCQILPSAESLSLFAGSKNENKDDNAINGTSVDSLCPTPKADLSDKVNQAIEGLKMMMAE